MPNLSRLFNPASIALFGGNWAENVIQQLNKAGYSGRIFPVHPKRSEIAGIPCFAAIDDLPISPDASFIGVNREATIKIVRQLFEMGAGGAICFASGYLESESESSGGANLQQALIDVAGDMPMLGPNCYGLINYLDNIPIWPDQHGGIQVENGVAIIAQSSNIAINLTMQKRNLPLGVMATVGNQAQTGIADIATHLLHDDRITAVGFYIEGFGDLRAFEKMAELAHDLDKPLVAIKAGKSEKSVQSAKTHTASLAGSAMASSAFLKRLGIIEVDTPEIFLETLKILHHFGRLKNNEIVSVSCSGGEASLVSDLAEEGALKFRLFSDRATQKLKSALGPIVTINNPLDYNTFIWGDVEQMTDVFSSVMADGFAFCLFILDIPRPDRCDPQSFECAKEAIIAAQKRTGAKVIVASLLPENTSEETARWFANHSICTINGLSTALEAMNVAVNVSAAMRSDSPALLRVSNDETEMVTEAKAKQMLQAKGLAVPKQVDGKNSAELVQKTMTTLEFPIVLKGQGFLHKSEAGAVKLNIKSRAELEIAMQEMQASESYLAEEMISDVVTELLVGVSRDETGLMLLTIGAGGVLTELLADTGSLILPVTIEEIRNILMSLKSARLLMGFRGKDTADMDALCKTILCLADYAVETENLIDLEINPLMVRKSDCVIADAVITLSK